MKLMFILLCSVLSFGASAQKTVQVVDPNATPRNLNSSFSAINVSDGIQLYLTAGSEESLAVSTSDPRYNDRFKTIVEDGVLKIYYDNKGLDWNVTGKRKLIAYVSFKTLNKLSATGGADVIVPVAITLNDLKMKFTSGTRFSGKIIAKELQVIQNSGSEIDISGSADKIDVEATSGAIFKGFDLSVDFCTAKATSGGAIRISINKELDAKANSGGAIRYKGQALIREVNVNSGGIVKKA